MSDIRNCQGWQRMAEDAKVVHTAIIRGHGGAQDFSAYSVAAGRFAISSDATEL